MSAAGPVPRPTRRIRLRRFWLQRVRPAWQSLRWPVLGALALAALILGHLGFHEHLRLVGEPSPLTRTLYLSLQLFTLESGSLAPPTPWTLDLARFLAPAVAFSTVAVALASMFREQLGLFRLRLFRDHVVVCGLGRKGALLATGFRERGLQVVAIERDSNDDAVAETREGGAVVLIGDATDETLLRKTRLRRARYLVSVCGEDGTNAEVAVIARDLVRGRRGVLHAFVHVVDVDLCNLLRVREMASREDRRFRLEFFNVYERGAGALLLRYPPLPAAGEPRPGGPHMVVVGLGQMGRSLVVQAARTWRDHRAWSADPLRITIIDRAAAPKAELLCTQYPRLQGICDLRPTTMDIRSAAFGQGGFLFDPEGRPDTDAVYVCVDDPALGLDAGLAVLQRIGGRGVPVVVRVVQSAGLATLLRRDALMPGYRDLHAFPLLDETCTPEVLLGGTYETLARAIHEDYVAHRQAEGQTLETNPALVPWDELPDHLKESNRDQAAGIGAKLEAVGCGIDPLTDWDATLLEFSPEEVELLARMEHGRWMRYHLAAGWRFAPGPRDPDRKTHPDLVPYEQLTEDKREYDRSTVRAIPAFLARAGFHAYRLG